MRDGLTPLWTLIIVPPTAKATTRRVGVKMRTVRRLVVAMLVLLVPVVVLSWQYVQTQTVTTLTLADRIAAQERAMAELTDSLTMYRALSLAEKAARLPPPDMIMPLAGRITSWYSPSRLHPILHIWRPHRGIDLAAPSGTRIVAPGDGVVASVSRKFGFGLTVEVVHSGGVITRYAHCRTAVVKPGDRIVRGQAIATVGSSGLATSPHLHFEVLFKGSAVDPVKFLASTKTATAEAAASTH